MTAEQFPRSIRVKVKGAHQHRGVVVNVEAQVRWVRLDDDSVPTIYLPEELELEVNGCKCPWCADAENVK